MTADIEHRSRIEVLAAAEPLNSAVLAFTPSLQRVLTVPEHSWPGAGEHEQIIGEHPQTDPPLHPMDASVATPSQSMTAFQRADASFAAGTPAQCGARQARARRPRLARQDDVPNPAVLRRALIAPRREAAVGHRQLRSVIEERDVPIQGRRPEGALGLAAVTHRVVGDDLPLGHLDLHHPAELSGLGQLALADDLGVRLEETDHLAWESRIAAEDPGPGRRDDPSEQVDRGRELRRGLAISGPSPHAFGLTQNRAGN